MELPVGLSRFAFKCPSKTNASLGNVCSLSAMSSFLLKCDLGCISVKSQLNRNLQQFLFLWNDMSHVVYMSHITSHINVYPCNNTKNHTLSFKTTAEYLKKVERNSCSFQNRSFCEKQRAAFSCKHSQEAKQDLRVFRPTVYFFSLSFPHCVHQCSGTK